MNDKAYLVLSIGELSRILRNARKSAHSNGIRGRKASKHCIVFRDIELTQCGNGFQICSSDINNPKNQQFA